MSHQDVAFLVRASDEKDAFDEARAVAEMLRKNGRSYDGFSLENAEPYDSEKGKSALQGILGAQILDFNEHLDGLRNLLMAKPTKTNSELMETSDLYYHCARIGDESGPGVRVFDADATGIQEKSHLKNVVEDWPSLVEAGKHRKSRYPLWIVWGDAHY